MSHTKYRTSGPKAQEDFEDLLHISRTTLEQVVPSRRAQALQIYQNRPRTMSAEDAAEKLAGMLSLDSDVGVQDFEVALNVRDRALAKILDASTLRTLEALASVWDCPKERIISEGLKMISASKPDGRFSDTDLFL